MGSWKTRKPWRQKIEETPPARVVPIPTRWHKRYGPGTMVIPHPKDLEALIRKIPRGKIVTQSQLRAQLAQQYEADIACPLTTGIFLRMVAEAAEEDQEQGKKEITPYSRVVKDDGSLHPKYPGGVEQHARYLRNEGHEILPGKGKKPLKVHLTEDVRWEFSTL